MSKYLADQASAREAIRNRLIGNRALPINAPPPQAASVQPPPENSNGLMAILQALQETMAPKGIKPTESPALQVAPSLGTHGGGGGGSGYEGGDGGGAGGAIGDLLKNLGGQKPGQAPADVSHGTTGAHTSDAANRGRHGAEPPAAPAPSIPGPYGKPMPPPGATVTGPQDYGGGTGGGVAGDVPGLPGGPSGRALTPEERKAAAGATATGNRVLPGKDLAGVDPRIAEIVGAAAEALPEGYKVRPTSGYRDKGQGQHTKNKAVDWQIVKPDGTTIPNEGEDTTGMYTKLAKNAYGYQEKNHPELTGDFNWGGAFGTDKAHLENPDLMHFDIGGRRGHITKYSRETIGTELPPTAGAAPSTTPATPATPAATATPATTAPQAAGPRAAGVPPELEKLVMNKEWFVDHPVNDYGRKTIGYGTDARGRTSITEPEARAEMNAQLQQHLNKIDANFPNLPPGVRNSLASMTFNSGEGWMTESGPGKGRLAAALRAGDMQAAKSVFKEFVHVTDAQGNKTVIQGLVNRRNDEARAFDGQQPQYTANPDAPKGSPANPNIATPALESSKGRVANVPPQGEQPVDTKAALESSKGRIVDPAYPAVLQPRQGTPASTAAAEPAQPAAPAADPGKPHAAVPYAGAGGMELDPTYAGGAPTATTTYDAGAAALNKIQPNAPAPAAPAPVAAAAAPPRPPVVAAAAPPPPPPRAAPPPPPKAATPPLTPAQVAKPQSSLDIARANIDRPLRDIIIEKYGKGGLGQVPEFFQGKSPREIYGMPLVGGQFLTRAEPLFKDLGVTRQDVERAAREPPQQRAQRAFDGTMMPPANKAPPTSNLSPFAGFRPEPGGVDDRRNTQGEGQRMMGRRLGMSPTNQGESWPPAGETSPDSPLARAAGAQDIGKPIGAEDAVSSFLRRTFGPAAGAIEGIKRPGYSADDPNSAPGSGGIRGLMDPQQAQAPQAPTISPEMAKVLETIFNKPGDQGPPLAPQPDAQPVMPATEPGGANPLPLAPPGLTSAPTAGPSIQGTAPMQMVQASQGSPTAMAGLMPIPPSQGFSTPSANMPGGAGVSAGLSPISPEYQSWETPTYGSSFSMPMDL